MTLDRVTITGADDSIGPEDICKLSYEFPFVEWGILASAGQNTPTTGASRFPSKRWIERLQTLAMVTEPKLSLHLCGRWVRTLLLGTLDVPEWLINGGTFQRVQLNFHAENTPCNSKEFYAALLSLGPRQYIFQIDGSGGNKHLEAVYAAGSGVVSLHNILVDAVPLFDLSGGAGMLPIEWSKPKYMKNDVDFVYHGYAGGLGPDNLETELPRIADAAGDCRIWIDMESKVRSEDNLKFDLGKVRKCLEICKPFIA